MLSRITRAHRAAAPAFAALMVSNLAVAGFLAEPALAEPTGGPRDDLRVDEPVAVTPVAPGGAGITDPSADQVWEPGDAALPEPETIVFDLDGSATATSAAVSVTTPSQHPAMPSYAATSGSVTVEVADAEAAGVAGMLVSVTGSGAGPIDLTLDYTGFADRFGGGWASRLRLVELPACALTTPEADGCLAVTPVESTTNWTRQTVSTRLELAGAGLAVAADSPAPERVFALMADASSEDGGDYRATDLSPAGSWAAGGNDGAFTYSYPMRVPPSAGPVPALSLGYSSASHDGRTSGRNGQASWIGDGWGYEPGFVERSYQPCSLDDGGSNNNPAVTGDLCWEGNGATITLSLNGTNTTLVRDDSTGQWRAEADANWRIELLGSPASSGSATTERWKVTTTDGTQYFFASEVSASSSRLTVPVFGNHSGEPCRSSQFVNSSCRQAWRWLVDKVIDVHGNLVRYFYTTTDGHYGAAGDANNRVSYHRDSRLTRIDYGLRDGASTAATGRVQFTAGNRCLSNCGSQSNPTVANWPDTPWDLHCAAAPCTSQLSPTFFSTHRLTTITTQVRDGSGFRDVDSWTLEHEFKDYGDDEQVVLWLKSIQQAGRVGGTITLPKVEFTGEALPNRVNAAAGVPVMWRWRMSSIKTETGAVITVTYAGPQCTPTNLPANAHTNSMRCYPVRWTPEFHTEPIEDWFRKHVVSSVVETDTTGGGVAVETYYEYATSGGGTSVLWAFDDSEFTEDEHRTYGAWRGYPQVTTRVGDPAQTQTVTRARFYRGMDGQPLPGGGTRSVSLTDVESNTVTDHEALAGQLWESLSYNGSTVISGTTYEYWTRKTATRNRDHAGGSVDAWLTGVSVERSRLRLTSSAWQRTETRTTFDNEGRVIRVNSLGDTAQTGDELCTRTDYSGNSTAWIRGTVIRSETVSVDCGTSPSRPSHVVSDTRTFYDGSNTHGATPSKGIPTRVDTLDDWSGGPVYVTTGRTAYDALGRVTQLTDALGHVSTTSYTPSGAGPVTQTVTTNPLGHQLTTSLEPGWGVPTATVEPNGRRTDLTYDALGRSTAVWLPGRNKATQTASMQFEYLVRNTAPSVVTTRRLNHQQQYVAEVVLFDSLLRTRQSQVQTVGGRLVDETVYDTLGRVEEQLGPNPVTGAPATTLVTVQPGDSARRFEYVYDAAGRLVHEVFYNKHVERWRTSTTYGGSTAGFMVTVQPPAGAPATATLTNARGEVVQKRTYRSNTPSGTYDALNYAYVPNGAMESMTDPAGNEWSWEYDLRGRQVAAHDPDAGSSTMAYDVAGQLVATTDARGESLVYGYDPLGRMVSRHDGDDVLLAEWEYDTAINGTGMLGKATRWVDGEAYVNEIRAVNSMGLVAQMSTTIPSVEGQLAGRYWFTQSYYPNGQLAMQGFDEVGSLDGGILQWSYDQVGNPVRLVFDGDDTGITVIVDDAAFTPYGEVQTRRLGAGNARHAYHGFVYEEDTRRLERATFDRQASVAEVADLRYSYDDAGNVLSVADVPAGLPGNHELQCFRYDQQRRLTEAWAQGGTSGCAASPSMGVLGGPAPYWHSYAHDVTGNRTAETLRAPGQSPVVQSYTYPAAGQPRPHTLQQVTASSSVVMSFGYDPAGNTTTRTVDGVSQTLSWDAEGRVVEVDEPGADAVRMVYDADGNRLIRDDGDTVTAYLPQTELTWVRSTNVVDGTRYFSHAGQVVAVCVGRDVADWTFMGVDHHGTTTTHSVNAFTGVEQVRRMDPYGNPRGAAPAAWPGQQGFVGGVQDPTGLVHIGARSYDPVTGRFLSADPILVLRDDQQINGYAYAHNNPTSLTDPTGLCASDGHNLCSLDRVHGYVPPSSRPRPAPVTRSLDHGGTAQIHRDGTVVVDGYVLPDGAPPTDAFLAKYQQAALETGIAEGEDPFMVAISWAIYACNLLMAESDRSLWCSFEFRTLLEQDGDAYTFGCLLPSYVGARGSGHCATDDREWTRDEYMLWVEMLDASGVEKQERQQELRGRGINHRPEGPRDLPRGPLGFLGGCVIGATGTGSVLSAFDSDGTRPQGSPVKAFLMRAVRSGWIGCAAGASVYMGLTRW